MKQNTLYYLHFFTLSLLFIPCFGASTSQTDSNGRSKIDAYGNIIEDSGQTPTTCSDIKKPVQDYSDPVQFMSDFLDINKKPEKPLKYWALQLVLLLRTDPKLINFCNKIKAIATNKAPYEDCAFDLEKRTKSINGAFIEAYTHQLFSEELSRFIFKDLGKVKEAIKKRAAKIS